MCIFIYNNIILECTFLFILLLNFQFTAKSFVDFIPIFSECNILKRQLNEEKLKNEKLVEEIQKLKSNTNDINNLKELLEQKDKEIQELKLKIPKRNVDMNEIIVINFVSPEKKIQTGIPCLPDDIFAEVEEKFYQQFNEFRNENNKLLSNGKRILRFKKVRENNIRNGDIVQIFKSE